MKSMTAFGQASLSLNDLQISVEVASVNKKNLEIVVNLPKELQSFEYLATSFMRKKVNRGRVRILVKTEPIEGAKKITQILGSSEFNDVIKELETFFVQKKQSFELSADSIVRLLQLSSKDSFVMPSNYQTQLISTLEKATEAMIEMRKKEGLEIATDFQVRIEKLDSMVDQMEEESKDLPEIIRKKLFERLQKADLEICSSDDRVLKELALYSEKFDVSEEITRLRSHLKQFSETCSTDGFIGRKLEFILQEINRELNTFCSKSAQSKSTKIAIEARVEIEKIREQAMNVE